MARLKMKLWLQRPPRVMWVLRVIEKSEHGEAIVRSWFPEYTGGEPPPPEVVMPVALACMRIAKAAVAGEVVDSKYSVELKA